MSLYQKYRPRDFDSLVGQEFVKISLKNALNQNKLVGAYLFYGSRGTGKTTVARILAKAVNCLTLKEDGNPCLECENCIATENQSLIDIIEIDAASNTGVDNIRELIEKAQFQPNQSKYKVYIIDEVHMLSKGAFNALLKTLEEPPKHVKFILATTELHKIPDTIISRTQRYDFKKISENDTVERLHFIAHSEGIVAEDEALHLIARLSRGGLRDAIAFFEQYSIGGNLKLSYLMDNLQLAGDDFVEGFLSNLLSKNYTKSIDNLDFLREKGIDVKVFLEEFLYFLHDKIIKGSQIKDFGELMRIYDVFIEIYSKLKSVPNIFLFFEFSIIKFLEGANINDFTTQKPKEIKKNEPVENVTVPEQKPKIGGKESESEKLIDKKIKEPKKEEIKESKSVNFDLGIFFESIKEDSGKGFILMSLKSSNLVYKDSVLKIFVNNEFNYKKLILAENKAYLFSKFALLFGCEAEINIVLNKNQNVGNDIINDALGVF